VEFQIASLRAELLHKEQENERVQLDLLKEREDREKAQKQASLDTRRRLPFLFFFPQSGRSKWREPGVQM